MVVHRSPIDSNWVAQLQRFRAAWWLPGGHAQTLSAAYWKGPQCGEQGVARRVPLPDGDVLVALDDCPDTWKPGDPVILMMHGLGGSARNAFLVRVSMKLTARGVRVFRLNLRGCGAGAGLARLPYNAGRSEDLKAAIECVLEWCRESVGGGPPSEIPSPLTLFGMSLSGNLLLKYLGEEAGRVPSAISRAMAINPPIDLARSVVTLDRPINKGYDRHFVQELIRHVERQTQLRPDYASLPNPSPRSLYDFDDRFTAPHGGYTNAKEYYCHASALSRMAHIQIPTLILTAADDPLVPVEMFEEHRSQWPTTVHLAVTHGGGHLGYVGAGHGDPDFRWLDWRVVDFVQHASSTES